MASVLFPLAKRTVARNPTRTIISRLAGSTVHPPIATSSPIVRVPFHTSDQSPSLYESRHPYLSNDLSRSFRSSSTWNWSKPKPKSTASEVDVDKNATTNSNTKDKNSNDEHQSIISQVSTLHSSVMPLNTSLRGPLAKNSDRGTSLPFVFLVGNHSSGKSSFINYVLGRSVQTAGVAPTDDCFTVIAPGPKDVDQDGPALVGDPDIGFEGLRQFGPTLIHHAQLKVREGIKTQNFMMVDSPGMIDSPVSSGGMSMGFSIGRSLTDSSPSSSTAHAVMDRGYDFQGVVRWFAERADVVLLFFDPDKPGTTGETLSILLHSLGGMDHKLLIVLNKADQFKKIHDFARAYGSLCWNLSKVIPRKDLPRIFTMCLPIKRDDSSSGEAINTSAQEALDQRALADLHQTRDDVVAEVMKAPKRRIDNVITNLHDSVHLLLMHAVVAEDVRSRYSKRQWENRIQEFSSLFAGVGLAALGIHFSVPPQFTGGVVAATVLGVGGLRWFNSSKLKDVEEQLLSVEELSASFQRTHPREVSEADEFYASVWQRVRDPLRLSLWRTGLADFPAVKKADIQGLQRILDEEIPRLRRLASPSHHGSRKSE
ncbi:hypothetical protein HJC23_005081 [Cyclotella cryptica]|uniref:Dynamin N-terminal domain-containing protein n=1 Tax=Cyclotella cryptica TaxID=29204 RepID=A0ABD3QDH1_9STRA|eukprot:CCRYP_006293-RB/>CCRYP_006293-RB protein AED:0.04 eAED:0.04 QI:132/1/1/1/1/1/3/127/596